MMSKTAIATIIIIAAALGLIFFIMHRGREFDTGTEGDTVGLRTPGMVRLAQGIAIAEGYLKADGSPNVGSNPFNWNNPGDLTSSFGFQNQGPQNSAGVLMFNSAEDGWGALYAQLALIVTGQSGVYDLAYTIARMAEKWTGSDEAESWASNVARSLGTGTDATLAQVLA